MNFEKLLKYGTVLILLTLLANCGNGGSISPKDKIVNSKFSGKMFIGGESDGPWIMDFSTGHYTAIPGVQWEDNPDYHHEADFSAYPSRDGQEFIETISQCKYLGGFDYGDCLVIHKKSGEIIRKIDVPHETHGPARFSHDRQLIAVPIQDPSTSLNPRLLTIFDLEGNKIDEGIHDVGGRAFVWMPDNSLLYASDQGIYKTLPNAAKGTLVVNIPENAGEPDQLAVSPDGKQLAFTIKTSANFVAIHGTTWILQLDGSDFRRLTRGEGPDDPGTTTDDPIINFPTWSPDGKWIAVVAGGVSGAIDPNGSTQADLFVVPTDGNDVIITKSGNTEAILINSYFEETFDFFDPQKDEAELSSRFNVFRGGLAWLP